MSSHSYNNKVRNLVLFRQYVTEPLFIQVSVPNKENTRKIIVDFVLVWWGWRREYIANPIKLTNNVFHYIESMDISDASARYLKRFLRVHFGIRHVRIRTRRDNAVKIEKLLKLQTVPISAK